MPHLPAPLRTTTDTATILELVGRALAADPVVNTVFSSIDAGLRGEDGAGWCAHPANRPEVLAIRSRPTTPVALTPGRTDVAELADCVPAPRGLGGPVDAVDGDVEFLAAWYADFVTEAFGRPGPPADDPRY